MADLRNGYPTLAETYHFPNWHEPSPTFDLFINRAKWEALGEHTRQAVILSAGVMDDRMRAATVMGNARALDRIVAKHGTKITPFPQDVIESLASHASQVVAAEVSKDPSSKELYEKMMAFRGLTGRWMTVTDHAYLGAREINV